MFGHPLVTFLLQVKKFTFEPLSRPCETPHEAWEERRTELPEAEKLLKVRKRYAIAVNIVGKQAGQSDDLLLPLA